MDGVDQLAAQSVLKAQFGLRSDSAALPRLLTSAVPRHVAAGDAVFAPGRTCTHFMIIVEGRVRVERATRSGTIVPLYRLARADTCPITTACLLEDAPYYAHGIAEAACDLIMLPAGPFRAAMAAEPKIAATLLSGLSARLSRFIRQIDEFAARKLDDDLAALLLRHQNSAGLVKLPVAEMAAYLDADTRVIVARLKDLEQAGHIVLGRGALRILNVEALSPASD